MFVHVLQNITGKRSLERIIKKPDKRIRDISIVDFYLHMAHHCVIGDNTIFMVFQLDSGIEQPDNVLVVSGMHILYRQKSWRDEIFSNFVVETSFAKSNHECDLHYGY